MGDQVGIVTLIRLVSCLLFLYSYIRVYRDELLKTTACFCVKILYFLTHHFSHDLFGAQSNRPIETTHNIPG